MNESDTNKASDVKRVKHHSTWSTVIVAVIFILAAIIWLFHVPAGIILTIIGGIVFGVTYK